jgi:hypothetical protein
LEAFDDQMGLIFAYNPDRDCYIAISTSNSYFAVVTQLGTLKRLQLGISIIPYFVWRYGDNLKDFKVEVA